MYYYYYYYKKRNKNMILIGVGLKSDNLQIQNLIHLKTLICMFLAHLQRCCCCCCMH